MFTTVTSGNEMIPETSRRMRRLAHEASLRAEKRSRGAAAASAGPSAPPKDAAPSRTSPRARWSRRRGVVTGFAAFAVLGLGAAYIGPLGSVLSSRASAEVTAPATLYAITVDDAQRLDTGTATAEPAALERGSYSVYVAPKPTPKPVQKRSTSASSASFSVPFVAPDPGTAQAIAYQLVKANGWGDDQFACLVALWNRESGWRVNAYNPSGAYGIPQALPGSKMAAYGSDWATNPATQIKWGLGYISGRYGTPCAAWSHSNATGWY